VLYPAELPGLVDDKASGRKMAGVARPFKRASIMKFREAHLRATRRRLAPPLALGLRLALSMGASVAFDPSLAGEAFCADPPEARARVVSITDRLEIALGDGRQARLAGLDLPDPGRGDPASAAAARLFLTKWLDDREVGLHTLSAKPDRWNRMLVELYAPTPYGGSPAGAAAGETSVSMVLISAGLARFWPEPEALACASSRLAAEAEARNKRLGLWLDPYYAVVEASDLDKLHERDGQFTLVEGTPSRVGEGRSRYFIDFGPHRGFTVVIPKRRAKAFERAGMTISALAGARIRVRGALDDRFGPRMTISEPEDIERLETDGAAKGVAGTP
jgi:micrococcal nuclease